MKKIAEVRGQIAEVKPLSSAFFNRDPRRVARSLLGKLLIRKTPSGILAGRIVETEAYLGIGDLAAHTFSGRTARNSVLFGPPGFVYVYFIYGNHYCLNVSCLPDGIPGGVLFRALEPIGGIERMAEARGIPPWEQADLGAPELGNAKLRKRVDRKRLLYLRNIASGPGRMCDAFGITRVRDNGKSLVSSQSDLQIVDDGYRIRRVAIGSRIGIKKSAEQPLRYGIADNPFVSVPIR
ncbi:MAG: DNA-3-methyladenine glycosylase [Bryobacteraceae bacterium]